LAWSATGIGLGAAAGWFAIFAVLHIASLGRGRHHAGTMLRAYASAALGLVTTAAGLASLVMGVPSAVLALANGCLAFACLFVLYVPCFYTLTTSLSVATLVLLLQRGGHLNEAELYERFAGRNLAAGRLSTLHESGYVIEMAGGHYAATPLGRGVARSFSAIKALLRLGPGG
jgi:hypothetical protein